MGGSLFWGTAVCRADESVDEASGASWGAWVELFYVVFRCDIFQIFKCSRMWGDRLEVVQNDQTGVSVERLGMKLSAFKCSDSIFFFLIIFFWTQSGKHESWFSHCWDDSESGDDCRTTQWTPTRLSPLWAECILYWGFCPRAAQLFLISLILLHQRGDCLTLLSRTQSDLGSVRHSHPQDDFRWIQQPKERCKLLLDRAQSSTREPKPPHYSLNCSTVGCRHSEDIHTVNVCFSAAQFSCKLTITSLQLHLNDLMLHNDRFVCGVNAVNGHSGQMLLLCLEWLCSHVPDILQI